MRPAQVHCPIDDPLRRMVTVAVHTKLAANEEAVKYL